MKRQIDVEKLLRWAIREELPKGRPVSTPVGALIAEARSRDLAAALSPSRVSNVDQFGFVPGSPHEDALVVKAALADLPRAARFEDVDDVRALFGDIAGIAEVAVASVLQSTFNPRDIVLSKVAMGERPQWDFGTPTPFRMMMPFRDAVGALRERPLVQGVDDAGDIVELLPNRGKRAMTHGAYDIGMLPRSPLTWGDPSPLRIGENRAEYLCYFDALDSLREQLDGQLAEFAVTPAPLARRPWITGQPPVSRVLSDGRRFVQRLELAPKRKSAGPKIESNIEIQARKTRAARAALRHDKIGV